MRKIPALSGFVITALLSLVHPAAARDDTDAYGFSFPVLNGEGTISLDAFRGSVILVVNTASECVFTDQYDGLQKLAERYEGRKFVILGVPSNDFGKQEPGDENTIQKFCAVRFGITFPMTGKVDVKGDNMHPFYKWAAGQAGILGTPKWNFHKYLIGADGRFVDWFGSTTAPLSPRITSAIDNALAAAK